MKTQFLILSLCLLAGGVSVAFSQARAATGTATPAETQHPTPQIANSSLIIRCDVKPVSRNGVILAHGGRRHGYALHLEDGRPVFSVRIDGELFMAAARIAPEGNFAIEARLEKDGSMTLAVDGATVAEGKAKGLIPDQPVDALSIGEDVQTAVGNYSPPNPLKGVVANVDIQTGTLESAMTPQGNSGYGNVDLDSPALQIPAGTKPLIDHWMRDTYVMLGPDGNYYLTGTTADPNREFDEKGPHCWDWNDGLYLWRSGDLKNWEPLGLVWSLDNDATWQKEFSILRAVRHGTGYMMDAKRRAVWAPELHYIRSATNWFYVACMNDAAPQKGSFILRSTTGKPEGPYENIAGNATGPIFLNIDGSLFEDDDGSVWFIGHNHYFARMKSDMSGLAEETRQFIETPYQQEPYIEGAFVFKHAGRYHLVQAIWSFKMPDGTFSYAADSERRGGTRWSYDCVIASADKLAGPYGPRYTAGVGIGHNNLFQDKQGNWFATHFGNPRGTAGFKQPFLCRPAIIPMKWDGEQFSPKQNR